MNVTPLIDVLLVLLIIFMLITPTKSVGLGAEVPMPDRNDGQADEPNRAIVVQVGNDAALHINSEPVDVENLGARLLQIFKARPERVLFVQAGGDTEFQHVARVVDIAKGAAIDHVGLLTAKLDPPR